MDSPHQSKESMASCDKDAWKAGIQDSENPLQGPGSKDNSPHPRRMQALPLVTPES